MLWLYFPWRPLGALIAPLLEKEVEKSPTENRVCLTRRCLLRRCSNRKWRQARSKIVCWKEICVESLVELQLVARVVSKIEEG